MRSFSPSTWSGLRVRFQRPAVAKVNEQDETPIETSSIDSTEARTVAPVIGPVFTLILVAGSVLRLAGLSWDQGTHIHPDERFLTMLGVGVTLPSSIVQYFDPATSPLSPYNTSQYGAMVYGMLPITLNKIFAAMLGNSDFGAFTIEGRALSALADIGTLIFVYLITRLFVARGYLPVRVAYLAATFYGIAVFPIQTSHFFTVDSFLNFFAWASVYFALRYSFGGSWPSLVASGALLGFSLACKVSGVYIAPLVAYLVICRPVTNDANPAAVLAWLKDAGSDWKQTERMVEDAIFALIVLGVTAYLGLRVGAPYYFQSANFLDPRLGHAFLTNLQSLSAYDNPNTWYPPGVQWVHKPPVTFALINLAVFGLGVPFFISAVAGGYVAAARLLRSPIIIVLLWTLAIFLYQSVQYVKTMRYFVLVYPALSIFAGIGLAALLLIVPRYIWPILAVALIIWPLAFMSIYTKDLTRVTASEWMYQHIPNGAYVVNEAWDDPLPLQIANPSGKVFPGQEMGSFDFDTPSKWKKVHGLLRRADYLVLSSNRGWGSIPTAPEHYPRMTQFYRNLFAGKTAYREVARFTSYPSLRYLGIPVDFPDQWAEEAFTVYDHPEVLIFEHIR